MKCDEDNVGEVINLDDITYTCVSKNGEFGWISEVEKIEKVTLLDLILQFLKNLFFILQF